MNNSLIPLSWILLVSGFHEHPLIFLALWMICMSRPSSVWSACHLDREDIKHIEFDFSKWRGFSKVVLRHVRSGELFSFSSQNRVKVELLNGLAPGRVLIGHRFFWYSSWNLVSRSAVPVEINQRWGRLLFFRAEEGTGCRLIHKNTDLGFAWNCGSCNIYDPWSWLEWMSPAPTFGWVLKRTWELNQR